VPRAAVAVALPRADFVAAHDDLVAAGYEPLYVETEDALERLLGSRDDVRIAVLDAEKNLDLTLEVYALLHEGGRNIPALILVPPQTLPLLRAAATSGQLPEALRLGARSSGYGQSLLQSNLPKLLYVCFVPLAGASLSCPSSKRSSRILARVFPTRRWRALM